MSQESGSRAPKPEKKSTIREIQAVEESRNILLSSREEIRKYVEMPLVSACEGFYDKNIKTLASSCNAKDIGEGIAYIIVDYDHLSSENQAIASSISPPTAYDGVQAVKIEIPIAESSTIEEINQAANEIVSKFQKQPATWVPTYTFDDMKKMYGIPANDPQYKPEDFIGSPEEGGYYWDKDRQLYYPSEELYRKAVENN